MFVDLCVRWPGDWRRAEPLMREAARLGYDAVAFDAGVGSLADVERVVREMGLPRPEPAREPPVLAAPGCRRDAARGLCRITWTVGHVKQAQQIAVAGQRGLLGLFDVVAMRPTDRDTMHLVCNTVDCDLVSLDLCQRLPGGLRLRPPVLKPALERGLHFELSYGGSLRNPQARLMLFSNVASLMHSTRGRGLVITSGAEQVLELRGPYDAVAMAQLFGVRETEVVKCVSARCTAVLARGMARQGFYGMVRAVPVDSGEQQQVQQQ